MLDHFPIVHHFGIRFFWVLLKLFSLPVPGVTLLISIAHLNPLLSLEILDLESVIDPL